MDFITGLTILADWKGDNYDLILVIIDRLTKMIYYEPVKITIDALGLAKMIINMILPHHGVPESIITDWGWLFISKFCYLLCYFLGIKKKLSTVFQLQTDSQTEKENSRMEAYLKAFMNVE